MARLGSPQPVETIFIGGGTPTRLTASQLERLLDQVRRWFPLEPGGEWTVEANPGTLDAEKADVLASGGVNRVSLGASRSARRRWRSSNATTTPRTSPRPGPDPPEVRSLVVRPDLRRPRLDPGRLAGRPGNRPGARPVAPLLLRSRLREGHGALEAWNAGQVQSLDEEVERAMYAHTIDRLADAGLAMYEISNFARPGHESRHNLVYWANDAYFGVGLGAARYVEGTRASNTRDLLAYLKRIEAGDDPTGPTETPRRRSACPGNGRPDAPPHRAGPRPRGLPPTHRLRPRRAARRGPRTPPRRRPPRRRRPPPPLHPRRPLPRRLGPLRLALIGLPALGFARRNHSRLPPHFA